MWCVRAHDEVHVCHPIGRDRETVRDRERLVCVRERERERNSFNKTQNKLTDQVFIVDR